MPGRAGRARFPIALALLLYTFLATPASSQYMYLDTNGDGVNTAADVVAPSGATAVDVWLDTKRNRDGSAATCASGDGPLSLAGYDLVLGAVDGTVTWGGLVNARPEFGGIAAGWSTSTRMQTGTFSGAPLLPGTYRLFTLMVTPASGTPSLTIPAPATPGDLASSSFISTCSGTDLDNTLKLGTDWFDTDGAAYGGAANQAPRFDPAALVALRETERVELPLQATDQEGEALTFALQSGPSVVEAVVTGALEGGRRFRAPLALTVIGAGRQGPPVTVSPNPLHPEGVISFETATTGRVRVVVIDVQGRTVAPLHDAANAAAGIHRIALRPERKLASGIYFVRVETPEGVRSVRFAVVK